MKRILVLLVSALLLVSTPVLAAGTKIGYVDLQKALTQCQAGKDAKIKMSQAAKKYNAPLAAKQKALEKLKKELEKQSLVLNDDARAAKEQDYQTKVKEWQRFTKDIQDELQQKEAAYVRSIIGGLEKVTKTIGEKEGYTLILERGQNSILYANQKIDLTQEVVKAYDKSYAQEKKQKEQGQ